MSKGNTFENDLLLLIFNAVAIADIAENDTSAPITSLFVSLHTADPGEAGNQQTNEATYTNYARVGVARTGAGWTVANGIVQNAVAITFPTCGATGNVLTHLGVGTLTSGAGKLLFKAPLSMVYTAVNGKAPKFDIGTLFVTEG